MTLQPQHFGLFFNKSLMDAVEHNRDSEVVSNALDYLQHATSDDPFGLGQLLALRYQFLNDEDSGAKAIEILKNISLIDRQQTYLNTLQHYLAWLSIMESVRQHPAWDQHMSQSMKIIQQDITRLSLLPDNATLLDEVWLGALLVATAVVYEDPSLMERATAIYQRVIDHHIHPEGYLKGLVDVDGALNTYWLQVSATAALVLMAEMADLAGVDLWSINNRGITPITATAYLVFYYYYPSKWKWEDGLKEETASAIIKDQGAFIEMVNHRNTIRDIDIMLTDQRPLFSVYCGGLATLTHGTPPPPKKKRWGLFG